MKFYHRILRLSHLHIKYLKKTCDNLRILW